jgi:hypothetical protein
MAVRTATPSWQLSAFAPGVVVIAAVALALALFVVRSPGISPTTAEPYVAPQLELRSAPIAPIQLPIEVAPSTAPNRSDASQEPAPAVEPTSSGAPSSASASPSRTTNLPSRFADDPSIDGAGLRGQTIPGLKFKPAR